MSDDERHARTCEHGCPSGYRRGCPASEGLPMTLPAHWAGPMCRRCWRPQATRAAWDDHDDEAGPCNGDDGCAGLCWGAGANCEDRRDERIREMERALLDAADDMEGWGAYAGDYFKEKWDLAGDVAKYRSIARGERTPEGQSG